MRPEEAKQIEITPYAILAAVLFNVNKTEKIKVKPDDGDEEVDVEVRSIGLETEKDALVCIMPMEKLMHYATVPYDYKVRVRDGHAIVSFEKRNEVKAHIYGTNGKVLQSESPAVKRLLDRMV